MNHRDRKAWLNEHGILGIHIAPVGFSGKYDYGTITHQVRGDSTEEVVESLFYDVKETLFIRCQ